MGALDHFLNGLDAVLKAGDRASAAKAAEREARAKKPAGAGARLVRGSFDAAPPVLADPSCCLAKRRVK